MEIKKINSSNLKSFSFQLSSADLYIEQSDANSIEIETDAILDQDYEIIEKSDSIEIIEKRRNFLNFSFFNYSKYFKLVIPESISLFISIASGDLKIINKVSKEDNKSYFKTKTIDVKLTSGDLSIENISTAIFIFSSTSSDISIENSKLGKTKIKGISSDLYLNNCMVDEIEAKTISGDVTLKLLNFNKIEADLKSGDISIICPKTKINGSFNTLSGDVELNGIEIDKSISTPYLYLKTLSGDISVNGKYEVSINPVPSQNNEPIKSAFEESSKKDEREKFIQLLVDGKISEKEAAELLKGFGFNEDEIDSIFEEYLFRKINKGDK
ncbi:MAG: DUF4097 domain-containing protein [Spirochaetales bacterium]|jgi:DUF4097 and DUF4098 domain-containing protein YvlB|nr:DUF4097 domain-containing protein [Exilispira sp.]NMC67251.1 DUF4097 domain-containing protein [Spirochaetales bacterium]